MDLEKVSGGGTAVTAVGCSPTFPGFESRPPLQDNSFLECKIILSVYF